MIYNNLFLLAIPFKATAYLPCIENMEMCEDGSIFPRFLISFDLSRVRMGEEVKRENGTRRRRDTIKDSISSN